MKLQFDSAQDYQLQAVKSVIKIFEGQPLVNGNFDASFVTQQASVIYTERGVSNQLMLREKQILNNIQAIQIENNISKSENLAPSVSDDKNTLFCPFNFTVEMETGTGKTYTYLRSIYALNKVYGFKKFVIVVPSVAIREGTIKNLQITHEHFQNLYDNEPINYVMYDSRNLTVLRNFAMSNAIQILIINVDSFTKDNNIINSVRETGIKPIEFIQNTKPIVIIDEPQNFETDIRRQAIANLNPLCTIRYSATHRNFYNLVYSLNPVQAYDLGLVKQIEVDGITSDENYNVAFIQFKGIRGGKKTLKAKLIIYANEGSLKQKDITMDVGEDLYALSNGRDVYKNGYILNDINAAEGMITFSNGTVLKEGETLGDVRDEIMKYQIERTVKCHFEKLENLQDKGIKVLSLFFIDRVSNYRQYDAEGNFQKGKFAIWFEAFFKIYQAKHPNLLPFETEKVHNGYFSSDKTGKGHNKKNIWTDTKGTTLKDNDTYALIMKEKERLLSMEEPLQFIFSHSALREGWDNPNVFQICTLNESKSDVKKRQEIGRGLRLPVNTEGVRVYDKDNNILTIIANESYEDFSKTLQNEIQEETSVAFVGRIKNARNKTSIKIDDVAIIKNKQLKTRFYNQYDTEELIKRAVISIKKMPMTISSKINIKTTHLVYTESGIEGKLKENIAHITNETRYLIPDVYAFIQNEIDLTRNTIFDILILSNRYEELDINPQMFLDNSVICIKQALDELMREG